MRDMLALQWWSRLALPLRLEMGDRKWARIALAAVDLGSASCFAGRSRCSEIDSVNRSRSFGLDFGIDSAVQIHYSGTDSVG